MKHKLRADHYKAISSFMLLRIACKDFSREERDALLMDARSLTKGENVGWGPSSKVIRDVLSLINIKRARDQVPAMTEPELKESLKSYLAGKTDPKVEEVLDALSNVREMRLGFKKFSHFHMPPEGIAKATG